MVEKPHEQHIDSALERLKKVQRETARLPKDPQLRAAALQLREVRKAENRLARAKERGESGQIDWANIEDVRSYVRDFKRTARSAQLDLLVQDRKCPRCCEGPIVSSRSWVIIWDESRGVPFKAICRSCYTHLMHEAKDAAILPVTTVFALLGGKDFETSSET